MQDNVLVTDRYRACLANFGLSPASDSQVLNISPVSLKNPRRNIRWTSPELLEGVQSINTSSSDIYSFACVSYEVFCVPVGSLPISHSINFQIFSGRIPFHEIGHETDDHTLLLHIIQENRPPRPSFSYPSEIGCEDLGLDDETWAKIEMCWDQEPDNRPEAKDVGDFLRAKLGLSLSNSQSQNTVTRNSLWGPFLELIK